VEYIAVAPGDTEKDATMLAAKILKMRLWDDDTGNRVWAMDPIQFFILLKHACCSYLVVCLVVESGQSDTKQKSLPLLYNLS